MAVSSLPGSSEIEPVLLELLGDEREWRPKDYVDELADRYSLTPEQLAEKLPSGGPRFYDRCNFAKLDLKEAGLVESPRRRYWRITERDLTYWPALCRLPPIGAIGNRLSAANSV